MVFDKWSLGLFWKEVSLAYNTGPDRAAADLPPLPVVRAQLLGVLSSPASKLARLLAEPGRQLAQVIKAHADQAEAAA